MNQKYKYLLKNTGILTISNFASKILVFLLVPLYTSVLSTAEMGIYDLIVSTVSLLYPVLTLNIVDGVMRFAMDKAYNKGQVALVGIRYIAMSASVIAMGLIPCHYIKLFQNIHGIEYLAFLYYLSYTMNQYFIQLAKGMEKVKHMAAAGIISTVMMLGGNILGLLVFKMGLTGFLWANILAQAVPAIYYFFMLRFYSFLKDVRYDRALNREMLSYCLPLIFSTVGWWINSASDRYVVTFLCGVSVNGVLSVSYKIPSIINTVFGMFGQAWQISAIKEYGKKDSKEFYADSFAVINFMMCAGCAFIIVLSKPLARLLYAKEFYAAWQYAPFLVASTVFNTASGLIGPMLSAIKDSKSMAKSAIYGAVANVFLNIVLVYLIGAQGAAIATAVAAFIIYYVRRRAIGEGLQIKNPFVFWTMWGLVCLQALLEIYTPLWVVEIMVVIIIVLMNYKLVKQILQRILGHQVYGS